MAGCLPKTMLSSHLVACLQPAGTNFQSGDILATLSLDDPSQVKRPTLFAGKTAASPVITVYHRLSPLITAHQYFSWLVISWHLFVACNLPSSTLSHLITSCHILPPVASFRHGLSRLVTACHAHRVQEVTDRKLRMLRHCNLGVDLDAVFTTDHLVCQSLPVFTNVCWFLLLLSSLPEPSAMVCRVVALPSQCC